MKNRAKPGKIKLLRVKWAQFTCILFSAFLVASPGYGKLVAKDKADLHYNDIGFFDVHVCNWPKRKLFFLVVFSTTKYDELDKVEVFDSNDKLVGQFDLTKYRTIILKKPAKTEKRAFLKQFEIPEASGDGWYTAKITMKNGKMDTAKDYVIIEKLGRATGRVPAEGAVLKQVPKELTWKPIPGADKYQVFITDFWNDNKRYSSGLLDEPKFTVPTGVLQSGGTYCWRVHARDTNEHVLLGDFNHGSLTQCTNFEIE